MGDAVVGALIGMAGGVIVALASLRAQRQTTMMLMASEKEKVLLQLQGEESSRLREKRLDRIIDAVSELLAVSDPESKLLSYSRAISCIHRVQLLLNLRTQSHKSLNGYLNALGRSLQSYLSTERDDDDLRERTHERSDVLESHSEVLEATKVIILEHYESKETTQKEVQ